MPTATPRRRRLRRLAAAALAAAVALPASPARAQDDEELETPDARYEGYADGDVALTGGGSTAMSYLLLAGLGVLAAGVMFKDAKRSHLD